MPHALIMAAYGLVSVLRSASTHQAGWTDEMTNIELESPKISQLISALQAMKVEHGDCRIKIHNDFSDPGDTLLIDYQNGTICFQETDS